MPRLPRTEHTVWDVALLRRLRRRDERCRWPWWRMIYGAADGLRRWWAGLMDELRMVRDDDE